MQNLFNSVKMTRPNSNVFDLSHDVKMSLNMGLLYPCMTMECVPGDKFNIGCETMLRFSPMLAPVMHRMDVYVHYFFVPNRILWDDWEKFIVQEGTEGAFPFIEISDGSGWTALADYLGLPEPFTGAPMAEQVSALPFAAYNLIYNEYYRDQNLIDPLVYKCISGNNNANLTRELRRRAWEHDYFTACLPFAQKGDSVQIPIAGFNDVIVQVNEDTPGNTVLTGAPANVVVPNNNDPLFAQNTLVADTSSLEITAASINELRRAFRLQEWLEKNARGGTRYIENIQAHFGVKSSDKRMQRPEYITGTKSPVVISEIVNTTGTEDNPQGNMAGHGVSITQGKYGSYYCEEHGYIMGIMSVMPKTAYQQGIPKHFLKHTALEHYWPSFAHIGEQAVENHELYAYTNQKEGIFGYVPRYAEYKYMPSRVAGDFRTTLDFWHLGRIFNAAPNLNELFIECQPDTRIFAVEDETDALYCHILHKIRATRSMPKFGTPGF